MQATRYKLLIAVIFWLHLLILLVWFGLFLVPQSVWPGRVPFHFWFIATITVVQLLWGVVVFRKFDIVCPLTTWMQHLRGYPISSPQNYRHSYMAELLHKLRLPVSYKAVNVILMITLVITAWLYFSR